ncbi:ATP synthase F1 subunit delta [Sediminitomix flava]|uniref:ATP synthase subunit delta n=1 Tax=Sediminitomix flava TaxID=379075 RepID=A0A315ZG10_SEDFL|nr:ATP synthase F1 subunit delta [Sediminitomix flava]PWJ44093.1 ATP synthase F1 subcomplex delta subunit [Sediminitomix flava]
MSANTRAAQRYAKSLITMAKDQGKLEVVKQDFTEVKDTLLASRELRVVLSNPIISSEKKNEILEGLFKATLDPISADFLKLVSFKGREAILLSISEAVINEYNALHEIQVAKVSTPFELNESLKSSFVQMVTKYSGKEKVLLDTEVDKELIGGFVLNIGDDLKIDRSVKSKLNQLKAQLV